jgi:branched-chain amino acid transport system ATP-binding protein
MMLSVRGLSAGYGDQIVVKGIDLDVGSGEVVCILGPNGAGKSTVARAVSGLLPMRSGSIRLGDQDISTLDAEARLARGVSLVPENRCLFSGLTVHDNLMLGAFRRNRRNSTTQLDVVHGIFPRLRDRARQPAGSLSGGEQQMLAIGRALMSEPHVLILDEPSLGLAPMVVGSILRQLSELARGGMGVLLIEQNAVKALEISTTAIFLETGAVSVRAPAADVAANDRLAAAYLGEVV